MPPRASTLTTLLVPAALATLAGTAAAVPPLPFPAVLELSSLDGDNGFVINGINFRDFSGSAVSSAGDVNGDGIDDLIIGAHKAGALTGESYVVFGKTTGFAASLNLSTLNGTNGFVINGINARDLSGFSVSSAGDVNGDGINDLIIGSRYAYANEQFHAGKSHVVFGRNTAVDVPFSAALNLSTLDGTNGFAINGIDMSDNSGFSVACAGDVNGDGIDDMVIGAPEADQNGQSGAGESYVVFGKMTAIEGPFAASLDLSTLDGTYGFVVNGINEADLSGYSVSSAGDVNADGIGDLIIGAHRSDPNGQSSAGETYVVFGKATPFAASLDLSTFDGTNGFVINGINAGDQSGVSVASAGDVNGDGIDDLIIGARYADPNGQSAAGDAYVVFGRNTMIDGPFAASFDLSALNGTNGFVLNGVDASDYTGISVAAAGDVNADGYDDLIIGASGADPNGKSGAGETYVVFGKATPFAASLHLSTLNGMNGFVLNGIDAGDYSGFSVSSAGDVNGDGISDLIIGAFRAAPSGKFDAGESYVVFGRAPAPSCVGDVNGDGSANALDFNILAGSFGATVAPNTNGDLNGDGVVDAGDFSILMGDFGCGNSP